MAFRGLERIRKSVDPFTDQYNSPYEAEYLNRTGLSIRKNDPIRLIRSALSRLSHGPEC